MELEAKCKFIADRIAAAYDGRLHEVNGDYTINSYTKLDPAVAETDEGIFYVDDKGNRYPYYETDGLWEDMYGNIVTTEPRRVSLSEYLSENVIDVQYIADSKFRFLYVRAITALGGPTIWIDTEHACVMATTLSGNSRFGVSNYVIEAVNEHYREQYASHC